MVIFSIDSSWMANLIEWDVVCVDLPPLCMVDHTPYNTLYRTNNGAPFMNSISANDLKTKGVGAIEQALSDQPEASVTVRGQLKYVVMSHEQYVHLRECELEAALAESKADLEAGRFVRESVEDHIKRLATLAD
jgi:hypothetical protein